MCGIVSLFNAEATYNRDVHQAFSQLLSANTVRGVHSTGLLYGGGFTSEVYKKAIPGYDFVGLPVVDRILNNYEEHGFIIGHNRAATRGSVSVSNAHPFEHGHISGVHNGTLLTYKNLVEGNDPMYAVDSEYIFHGLEQSGAEELIPKINGPFNLLWYNSTEDTVHMIRNEERPYYFAKIKDKDILFGASEMAMLQWILNRNGLQIEGVIVPDSMTEYVFNMSSDDPLIPVEVKHKEYEQPVYHAPVAVHSNNHPTVERVPRTIEFFAEAWSSYGTSVPDTGKWECRTPANERVVVYQCKEADMEAGTWYTGVTRTVRNENAVYSVEVLSVKELVGDGPKDAVADEMYRCVSCKDYYPEDELMFCDNAPLCQECINHYELDLTGDKEKCH